MKLDGLVNAVDLRRANAAELLDRIDEKIDRLTSLTNKVNLVTIAATILLFASLYGVDFEIDFLGIKLSGLAKLKELIFCAVGGVGVFLGATNGSIRQLREIRKRLFVRKYGKAAYDVYEPVFNDDLSYDFDVPLGNDNYFPTRPTIVIEGLRIFLEFVPLFVGAAAALFITVFIAFDIWDRSNLPEPWGKVLVLIVYVSWVLQLIFSLLSHVWRFRFIDRAKEKELEVTNPATGELNPILKTLINRNVAANVLRRNIWETGLLVIASSVALLSATEFERILGLVRSMLTGVSE